MNKTLDRDNLISLYYNLERKMWNPGVNCLKKVIKPPLNFITLVEGVLLLSIRESICSAYIIH